MDDKTASSGVFLMRWWCAPPPSPVAQFVPHTDAPGHTASPGKHLGEPPPSRQQQQEEADEAGCETKCLEVRRRRRARAAPAHVHRSLALFLSHAFRTCQARTRGTKKKEEKKDARTRDGTNRGWAAEAQLLGVAALGIIFVRAVGQEATSPATEHYAALRADNPFFSCRSWCA